MSRCRAFRATHDAFDGRDLVCRCVRREGHGGYHRDASRARWPPTLLEELPAIRELLARVDARLGELLATIRGAARLAPSHDERPSQETTMKE